MEASEIASLGWHNGWSAPGGGLCAAVPLVGHPLVERLWLIAPAPGSKPMMRAARGGATVTLHATRGRNRVALAPARRVASREAYRVPCLGIELHPWVAPGDGGQAAVERRLCGRFAGRLPSTAPALPPLGSVIAALNGLPLPRPDASVVDVACALSASPTRATLDAAVERSGPVRAHHPAQAAQCHGPEPGCAPQDHASPEGQASRRIHGSNALRCCSRARLCGPGAYDTAVRGAMRLHTRAMA